MTLMRRRTLVKGAGLGLAGTVATAYAPRKSAAEEQLDDLSGLQPIHPPRPTPTEIVFRDADGTEHRLTEFSGHAMVINLWATWCVPCVAEMPSLAKLSLKLAPLDIAVMPLSSDRGGASVVQKFFETHGISGLPVLLDPHGDAARAFGARGLPTTFLIDRQGKQRAWLEGAADWGSADAAGKIRTLIG